MLVEILVKYMTFSLFELMYWIGIVMFFYFIAIFTKELNNTAKQQQRERT